MSYTKDDIGRVLALIDKYENYYLVECEDFDDFVEYVTTDFPSIFNTLKSICEFAKSELNNNEQQNKVS